MMRKPLLLSSLIVSLSAFAAGCTTDLPMDGDEVTDDLKADGADTTPGGRFGVTADVHVGDLANVTLNADHTFSRQTKVIDCTPESACAPELGTYKLTHNARGDRYVRFYDVDGTAMDRYAYTLKNGFLGLRLDSDTRWFTLRQAVMVDEHGDGTTVKVAAGQELAVRLVSNPTTGYRWEVVATDRTFGYPASDDFVASSSAIGAGGAQTLVWSTAGAFPVTGQHTVRLAYRRPGGAAARTFTITADVH